MYGDALTTKERIKGRLQITVDTFDDVINRIILGVTARIETMCGRRFIEGAFTHELHDGCDAYGTRRQFLILKNAPIQTISAIQYNVGSNSDPDWRDIDEDDYTLNRELGTLRFAHGLPSGYQNIRVSYSGGFSGNSIGVNNFWAFNITPTGTVNGVNLTFTLPEDASQVIVYADGIRVSSSNVTFTAGEDEFTLAAGQAPFSTIAADYLRESDEESGDFFIPAEIVEVCEEVVVATFKRRDSEGRSSETFQESSITWRANTFTEEHLAAIKNWRRGYNI